MNLFYNEGGNIYIAPIIEAANTSIRWVQVLPFLFFLLFLVAIPLLAHLEEKIFRKGNHKWPDIIKQSVVFGLIHCLVGISLAAGIALIGTGFFYANKYRKTYLKELKEHNDHTRAEEQAVLVSTTYHSFYNSVIIITLIALQAITVLN
ncbi:MAG TPA: hypothetical protein VFQ59_02130 [Candidatus Paceibacterota bacterium]|nr:hypothetical protein [Candidatus Paceibacterota bacterium]